MHVPFGSDGSALLTYSAFLFKIEVVSLQIPNGIRSADKTLILSIVPSSRRRGGPENNSPKPQLAPPMIITFPLEKQTLFLDTLTPPGQSIDFGRITA
jgi:hypothetical protein